jgi:hypothetical protein
MPNNWLENLESLMTTIGFLGIKLIKVIIVVDVDRSVFVY